MTSVTPYDEKRPEVDEIVRPGEQLSASLSARPGHLSRRARSSGHCDVEPPRKNQPVVDGEARPQS